MVLPIEPKTGKQYRAFAIPNCKSMPVCYIETWRPAPWLKVYNTMRQIFVEIVGDKISALSLDSTNKGVEFAGKMPDEFPHVINRLAEELFGRDHERIHDFVIKSTKSLKKTGKFEMTMY